MVTCDRSLSANTRKPADSTALSGGALSPGIHDIAGLAKGWNGLTAVAPNAMKIRNTAIWVMTNGGSDWVGARGCNTGGKDIPMPRFYPAATRPDESFGSLASERRHFACSKPCIPSCHWQPTTAPLTGCNNANALIAVSGSQIES